MKKVKLILCVPLIAYIFFVIPLTRILDNKGLFFNDPYNYMYLTEFGESNKFYTNRIELYDTVFVFTYKSFMRSEAYIIHLVTGASFLNIFRFFGILPRILLILTVVIIVRCLVTKRNYSYLIFTPIILFGGYYFWWRFYETFTENFVVLFFYLTCYCLLKKTKIYLSLGFFFAATLLLYHGNIAIAVIPFFISSLVFLYDKKYRFFWIFSFFVAILLIFPIYNDLIQIWTMNFHQNLGSDAILTGDTTRFYKPGLDNFIINNGLLPIVLLAPGFIFFLKKTKPQTILLFTPFLFYGYYVALGKNIGINLSSNRNQAFFYGLTAIMLTFFITSFFRKKSIVRILTFFFLVVSSFLAMNETQPWLWRKPQVDQVNQYLISNYRPNNVYYFSEWGDFTMFYFPYFKNVTFLPSSSNVYIGYLGAKIYCRGKEKIIGKYIICEDDTNFILNGKRSGDITD